MQADDGGASCVELFCDSTGEWQGGEQPAFCQRSWDGDGPSEGACPDNMVICGFAAYVTNNLPTGDNTALNGIHFHCCPKPGAKEFLTLINPCILLFC